MSLGLDLASTPALPLARIAYQESITAHTNYTYPRLSQIFPLGAQEWI